MLKKMFFMFPGQGAQQIGMGKDLYDAYPFVRELYDMAEEITKLPLKRISFEGPMEELTQTIFLQPALTVVSLAFLRALQHAQPASPVASAGHSLGEYSALVAANVLTEEDAIRAVYERGRLMQEEAIRHPGGMTAIIGPEYADVEKMVEDVASPTQMVSIANHNLKNQVVITGLTEAVSAVSDIASGAGARVVPLKVSGAWHSGLMKGAIEPFAEILNTISFSTPITPVYFNVTAAPENAPEKIRQLMIRQICSPVRWYDSMQKMLQLDADIFVELGSGKVLSGLFAKTRPENSPKTAVSINSLAKLNEFLAAETS